MTNSLGQYELEVTADLNGNAPCMTEVCNRGKALRGSVRDRVWVMSIMGATPTGDKEFKARHGRVVAGWQELSHKIRSQELLLFRIVLQVKVLGGCPPSSLPFISLFSSGG